MELESVSRHYDELLAGDFFDSTCEQLAQSAAKRELLYSGRACFDVLRPHFMKADVYRRLQSITNSVMEALQVVYRHVRTHEGLQQSIQPFAPALAYERNDPSPFGPIWQRFDAFICRDGELRFAEVNTLPGGVLQNDLLADVYETLPIMQEFRRRYPARSVRTRHHVAATFKARRPEPGRPLANLALAFTAGQEEPVEEYLLDERELFQAFMAEKGAQLVGGFPEEFEYRDDILSLRGVPIDIVIASQQAPLLEQLELPLFKALRAGHARLITDYGWTVTVGAKSIFEPLTDPTFAELFGRQTFELLQRHIPWTRRVYERTTSHGDQTIDLLPFILANQENLVLKPIAGEGGQGVVLGWKCDAQQWSETLQNAASAGYVVQQRIFTQTISHPVNDQGRLHFVDRVTDFSPYVWEHGGTDGAIIRMSASEISNLGSGGSKTALFLVD